MTSESRFRRHTISLPLSERRSTPRLRWLRPLRRKKTLTPFRYASAPDQCRSQAPLVGSIFTTSALRSARIWTAEGPCRKCVKLRTFTPFNIVYPALSVSGRQTVANKSPIPRPHRWSRGPSHSERLGKRGGRLRHLSRVSRERRRVAPCVRLAARLR